jgi:tetratricopeptide (TPR) repeat protein
MGHESDTERVTQALLESEAFQVAGEFEKSAEVIIGIADKGNKVQKEEIATRLASLAHIMGSPGNYAIAIAYAEESLRLRKLVLGTEHPDTLTIMHDLAEYYPYEVSFEKAEAHCVETLGLRQQFLGEEHPDTLKSMSRLALLYSTNGFNDQAESLFLETLRLRKKVLGVEHLDTMETMNWLAFVYYEQGLYWKAEPLHVENLRLHQQIFGNEHRATLRIRLDLADIYDEVDCPYGSKPMIREAEQFSRHLHDQDPLRSSILWWVDYLKIKIDP